jgi:hypothetical protein
MTVATINRFIRLFADAFEALSAEVSIVEIERLAMLIHHSMDRGRRVYHTSSHVFDMCREMNPRQVLATVFHDLVYYQLDGGFPRLADALLKPVVRAGKDSLVLAPIEEGDAGLALCAGVFGFEAGQTLPLYAGLNEFLSAVVATRLLHPHLRLPDLIAIVAGIEATIPFRGLDAGGRETMDVLADRVREVSRAAGIPAAEGEVARVVTDAVILANRDVGSFAEADPATFLATTWLLIEESNSPLAAVGIYSIQEYRRALSRMEQFLGTLDANHVFHRYDDVPGEAEFAALRAAARRNLAFACDYLGAKIVAIAIVEALALVTGGDCPVSMFLGDIRSPYGKPDRVEDFLPALSTTAPVDPELVGVLEKGRAGESASDLNTSPLTAFIYRWLGRDHVRQALEQARRMFAGELPAPDFLGGLDPAMVRAVTRACGQVALSRRQALLGLERDGLTGSGRPGTPGPLVES